MEDQAARRARNLVLAVLTAFVAAWPLLAPVSPLQDQMDWLAQAKIIAHPADAAWGQHYDIAWRPIPNLLGIALIAGLANVLPVFTAAKLAYAGYLVLFVWSLVYLFRADGRDRPLLELLAPMYAANHFFLMGFYNFNLGLALAFLAFARLIRRDRAGVAATPAAWAECLALTAAIYLSHLIAFAVFGLGCLLYGLRNYRADWRRWAPLAVSFALPLGALFWYAGQRSGQWSYDYAFINPLYYIWFQVGPWAPASSYYPVTPAWAVWINATINFLTVLAVAGLLIHGLVRRRYDWASPWLWTSALLIVVGLVLPARLYEVVRPGQRLIFAGLLLGPAALLAGTSAATATAWRRRYRIAAALLGALLVWNAVWWFHAARLMKTDIAAMERCLPDAPAKVVGIADSHFHFREGRPYREKAADPYSFPNSVNPYRYLSYHHVIEHGGHLGALFGTGIIHVRQPLLLPSVNRVWQLQEPQTAGQYTHVVAAGTPRNLHIIKAHAAELFDVQYDGARLVVLKRRGDSPTAPRQTATEESTQ